MSELAIPTGQLPAHLQGYELEANTDLITGTLVLPRISLRGKQFRFRKEDKEKSLPLGSPLRVVILGASPRKGTGKIFYEEAYQEGTDEPPTCSSANGIVPDSWIMTPVSVTCATCPNNAWGSGVNASGEPTKGKACADTKYLLVVPPDAPEGDIWSVRVPPTSLKLLSNYGLSLQQHKIPIEGIITQMVFADSEYPKLEFSYHGFTAEAYGSRFIERARSVEFKELRDKLEATTPLDTQQVNRKDIIASTSQAAPPAQSSDSAAPEIEEIPWGDTAPQQSQDASSKHEEPSKQKPLGKGVQAPDGSWYISPAEEIFDATKHATKTGCVAGSIKRDGSFKARSRRGEADAPAQQTAAQKKPDPSIFEGQASDNSQKDTQADDTDELHKILEQWDV